MSNATSRKQEHHFAITTLRSTARWMNRAGLLCALVALAAVSAFAQVSVLTQHNDNARTGQNTAETVLNTSNVKLGVFGKLFALPVTGQVYAQPLYVPNVTIGGVKHNLLIVATEQDMVYAFDADVSGAALWFASMVDVAHGGTTGEEPLNSQTTIGCSDLQPFIGITSTPVIDPVGQTIYLEAKSTDGSGNYFHRLHALSLLNGAEKAPGPVRISATKNGTQFQDLYQMNRPGILLQNNVLYLAFASHCDITPYEGWIFAYDTAGFAQKSALVTESTGNGLGGFWSGGAGVAADSLGNIYIASGNGTFDTTHNPPSQLGDTLLKIGTTNAILTVLDYFTPSDQSCLESNDTDLGSGGVLLLPDQTGAFPHQLVQVGKEGMVYVVSRDQLTSNNTHYNSGVNTCTSTDPEIIEESPSVGGLWGMPAYWNNNIYFWGVGDVLKSVPIQNGLPNFSNMTSGTFSFNYPGATPSISSNGTTAGTGILWAINTSNGTSGPAVLHALDATNVTSELWNSSMAAKNADRAGNAVKFAVPTVANGKVYIGTTTEVDVYGLLTVTVPATPTITPGTETTSNPVRVRITDSTAGSTIYYTTDGSTPTTGSTKFTTPFTVSTTTTVNAIAVVGATSSAVATATYTIGSVAAPTFSPAPGVYSGSVTVTLSATGGALIYYTTDGSKPSPGQGTTVQYLAPFKLTKTTRVNAIAVSGGITSAVAAGAYRITP